MGKTRHEQLAEEIADAYTHMDRRGQDGLLLLVVRGHWQMMLQGRPALSIDVLLDLTRSLSPERRRELCEWLSDQFCSSDVCANVKPLDPDVWGTIFPELRR